VIVTDARLASAVAVIRSLGRRGMHVVAADSSAVSAGFYSRFAAARVRYPDPTISPSDVVETLLREARARRIDLIVPVTDEIMLPVSDARERFAGVCALALPSRDALAAARDKVVTHKLARSLGIATPNSAVVATAAEALAAADGLGWPVVLKPQVSRSLDAEGRIEAFGVGYARDPHDLTRRMQTFEGRCSVLLQEYCGGEARGVGLLMQEGKPIVGFEHRRLREVPISGGASSFRESVELEGVHYESAVRLLEALRWTGLAMVEFKGPAAAPKLMEINGRIWGSLALAVKSGVDFPAYAAELYLHGSRAVVPASYTVGVRSRDLRLELSWIASVLSGSRAYPFIASPSRRDALGPALRLVVPTDGYDVLSHDDPRPGLVEIASLGTRLYRKVLRSRRPSPSRTPPPTREAIDTD
jgi:predicted ATP-grasp superfamily ATP-dependent carboligase